MEGFIRALGIDPAAIAKTGESIESLSKVLQEIRDAVILQNWLTARLIAQYIGDDTTATIWIEWAKEHLTTTPLSTDPH